MMKNKIILVGGYCATGKSTFSRKLSQELNIPFFNKDIIKETLGDGFGSESGEVYKKGSAVTFMLMLHIAERFLQAGQTCILESNFKPSETGQIKILLEKYNAECLTFIFKADLDVVFDRYIERDKSVERHWVHLSGENISKEAFKTGHIKAGLSEAAIGETICVDATSFDQVNYNELFNTAEKFIFK
jgi:predicted kinase